VPAASKTTTTCWGGHHPQCSGRNCSCDCHDDSDQTELVDWAWTIICNAGGGDWTKETPDWQDAAARFRDAYHAELADRGRDK